MGKEGVLLFPPSRLPASPFSVFDGVASLLDKSLLTRSEEADGDPRYGMLETIRHFWLERLAASGEADEVRRRHAFWCLDLAERAAAEFGGPEHVRWLRRLDGEHPNIRQAMGSPRSGAIPPSGISSWRHSGDSGTRKGIWTRGAPGRSACWRFGDRDETIARAAALGAAAMVDFRQGNYPRAMDLARRGWHLPAG